MRTKRKEPLGLIEIEALKTWFPVKRGILSKTIGFIKAVNGVSLTIQHGETVGLVGESGCGKTTLGRTILGLERIHAGRILIEDADMAQCRGSARKKLRKRVQMIFQDPLSSLNPRMNIMDILTEGLVNFGMLEGRRKDHAERILKEVGLSGDTLYRFPHEFSGGQRQRISIARAISVKPDFVVCDEAVSALDVSVQAQVINLLMDLQAAHGLSYLFISHDLSVVAHIAGRIAVMYLGRIVEEGQTRDIINNALHPYTRVLISAVYTPGQSAGKRIKLKGEVPSSMTPIEGCPFYTRCPDAMEICALAFPSLFRKETHRVWCHLYC